MDSIYVFGHKNPDTDSVVSAIAYSSLMNSLGEGNYIASRLGHLNDETMFLMRRFDMALPRYMTTVKTQVRDLEYDTPPLLGMSVPLSRAWQVLSESGLNTLPIVRDDGTLFGLATAGTIAECDMSSVSRPRIENVSVFNLLGGLEGTILNTPDDLFDSISGEIVLAMPGASGLQSIGAGSIVLCGSQQEIADAALEAGAACLVLCESSLSDRYRGIHSNTCIIASPYDALRAARLMHLSIPVERLVTSHDLLCFHLEDYLDDVRDKILESRYRSYPVLDENDKVVGTIGRHHLLRPRRKKVVLLDHNERAQSVDGLEQADIVAIVDHHRLADVQTGYPTYMRNEPVGSSTTIVATMYQERGLMPSPKLAGLMVGAILSDTVLFKSPTCTQRDKNIAERLSRIANVDIDSLGHEMFSAGVGADKPAAKLLSNDFKEFHLAGQNIGIGQISCL